jgi:hypothetical protein
MLGNDDGKLESASLPSPGLNCDSDLTCLSELETVRFSDDA